MERAKFGSSQPLLRREDPRFLTGQGRYVADIVPVGALHALFLRSPVAHGRITRLDLAPARAMPGVHLALAAADMAGMGVDLAMRHNQVTNRDGSKGAAPERPILARDVVRFAGEGVAVIVADSLDAARDAAELVELDIDDLPVWLDRSLGGEPIHAEAPANCAYDWGMGDAGRVGAALEAAVHRVTLQVVHNRVMANAIEPRGCFAEFAEGRLHLCVNGQGVWAIRRDLARQLGLAADAIRVTNPDVGGGFGMKAMGYPEYIVTAACARALGRPVAWMAERGEGMMTDNAGRDLVAQVEMGFDQNLKITAYHVDLVSNLGAYNSEEGQIIQSELFAKVLTGVYDIPNAAMRAVGVYTNTCPVDAYRGAGRPEAILTIERMMDHAARVLGADPFTLRSQNFIRSFPYTTATDEVIDVGDFDRVLARARAEADVAGFAARKARSAAKGLLRGQGLGIYIEAILGDPDETARITLDSDGGATLYVGTQSNGQGHETVFPRLLAAQTGIPEDQIRMVQGDSDRIAKGGGTGGSRSVTVQSTATRATAIAMIDGLVDFLNAEWGVQDVAFADHAFGAPGTNHRLTMLEAAALARAKGRVDLLDVAQTTEIAGRSYPNGVHICEVEIDPDTGALTMDCYTVVDDFGNLVAPALVMGQ
ncbi:MAG: xanthine dehydrogenase family protein molybdopterin-binding subunit, partial [Rhodobacteraceae bacterium]|nr:xanthine dehydrogenase family protein molybdopterin-binding subunit [Paracoccaceae bacterium]